MTVWLGAKRRMILPCPLLLLLVVVGVVDSFAVHSITGLAPVLSSFGYRRRDKACSHGNHKINNKINHKHQYYYFSCHGAIVCRLFSSPSNHNYNYNNDNKKNAMDDDTTTLRLLQAQLSIPRNDVLVELSWLGYLDKNTKDTPTLGVWTSPANAREAAILTQISDPILWESVLELWQQHQNQHQQSQQPPSFKSSSSLTALQLWNQARRWVNRDGGLYDNLPYTAWSVHPPTDAAGQVLVVNDAKRRVYQRLLVQSATVGSTSSTSSTNNNYYNEPPTQTLQERIRTLQRYEWEMELAETNQQLAILRRRRVSSNGDNVNDDDDDEHATLLLEQQEMLQEKLRQSKEEEEESAQNNNYNNNNNNQENWFSKLIWGSNNNTKNQETTTQQDSFVSSASPTNNNNHAGYASSFHLLLDILQEQMKARVLGVVLEPESLLWSLQPTTSNNATSTTTTTTQWAAAVILQRQTATNTTTLLGETLTVSDPDQTFGNPNVTGGTLFTVSATLDEGVGLAAAADVPIRVPASLLAQTAVPVRAADNNDNDQTWQLSSSVSLSVETHDDSSSSSSSSSVYSTDNPVSTLAQYDALTDWDKARLLLRRRTMARLPRPRVVGQNPALLDDLLLPYVDETVRRQFQIRQATQAGDRDRVRELESQKSRKQRALEQAEIENEQNENQTEIAAYWDSLRADPTQDEGSYSQFLDRDDWYERERLARVQRMLELEEKERREREQKRNNQE